MSGDRPDRFDALAAAWDRRLAAAGPELEREAPPASVWDRISSRIDELEGVRDTLTVRSDAGVWQAVSPGVHRKLLHVDAAAGWRSFLLKVDPGFGVAPHAHPMLEECLVLEGSFEVDGEVVGKGDLHLGMAGHPHAALFSRQGALLYIRAGLQE
jgi:anti-sigma factor ChrR (cupin superfamily)